MIQDKKWNITNKITIHHASHENMLINWFIIMQEVKNQVTLHHPLHDIMLINLLNVTITIRQEIYYSIKLPNTKKEMKLYSTKSLKKNMMK